ncbi:hypothetical protein [Vagococcus lutrae]|uniref:hypothetical protein n=1 Tax=Vagococcus lutrae TaxID=81947 RepID=UPI0028928E3E|nr:hypothetical protein [Vagococcus lutrae]MDT2842875.1 hypothetical protein [Vagococcus lutrae]
MKSIKILEYRDNKKQTQRIPLLKCFFSSVSYPLTNAIPSALLTTHSGIELEILGTDFKVFPLSGGIIHEK